ncbi:hypothetical protein KKC17_04545 [Patescibacteria group bacterium]|nr:hypothetical protein [Patescibacteria group bacterium]
MTLVRKNKNRLVILKEGFTTFEFAIAFTVVGVIAVISVILIANSRIKLRDGRRLSDMINLNKALLLYNDRYSEQGFKSLKCIKQTPVAVSSCSDKDSAGLTDFMPGISFLNDPLAKSVCRFNPLVDEVGQACQPCNYSFVGLVEADRYNVAFCLEKGNNDLSAGLHYLTESGLK